MLVQRHLIVASRLSNVGLTLVQRRRRWTNVKPILTQRLAFCLIAFAELYLLFRVFFSNTTFSVLTH